MALKDNKFNGADDIYMTDKRLVKINVITSKGKTKETRSLYKKTSDNLRAAKEAYSGAIPYKKATTTKKTKKSNPVKPVSKKGKTK